MKTLIGWTDGYGNNEKAYGLGDRKKIDMTIELADGKIHFTATSANITWQELQGMNSRHYALLSALAVNF